MQADGSVTVTAKPSDPLRAGSLTITGTQLSPGVFVPSVQALAFAPLGDPADSDGVLIASAGTLYITGPINFPLVIDSGATLEFAAANNGAAGNVVSSTFLDTGGTLKLDAVAQNTSAHPTNFTGDIILDARSVGPTSTDVIDLAGASVTGAALAGTTLTVTLTGGGTETYTIIGGTPGAVQTASDGAGGTNLFLTPVGSLWGTLTFPLQVTEGAHFYGPAPIQFNSGIGAVGIAITPADFHNSGPDIVLNSVLRIDPFLLPYDNGFQAVPVSETTVSSFPDHFNIIEPVINSATGLVEQILTYETQDAGGNPSLKQIVISEGTGGANSPWTVGTPTQIVPTLPGLKIENLGSSFTNAGGVLSNYSIAWDQFDPVAHTDQVFFDIFNANGSLATASPVLINSVSGAASPAALPAWQFRSAGGGSAYAAAVATNNAASVNDIVVQGYNNDGTVNPALHFTITPDLSAFAPGATNMILDEVGSTDIHGVPTSALTFTPNPTAGSGYSIAWNETVIDSNGVRDQVEFAIFRGGSVISQSTFQPPNNNNSQSIRLVTFNYLGQNFEVLAYGDGSETHIVEFDNLGNQVAAITDLTPQLFSQLTSLGDGRIGLTFNENVDALGTSQLHMDVFDLRTTGLTVADTGIANGQNIDFAGTRFNDVVQGSNTNNIDNTYYYVGANTTGVGPTDFFHGGTGAGSWNTAILPDGRANYSVVSSIATVITNTDPQHAHAGTLTVDHVQALVFNPTHDPVPASDGSLQATGDTLLLLSPFSSEVTFDSNATLELAQPSAFTGHVVNFAPGNFIDLDGFSLGSTSISYSGTSESGALTVTDATHSGRPLQILRCPEAIPRRLLPRSRTAMVELISG